MNPVCLSTRAPMAMAAGAAGAAISSSLLKHHNATTTTGNALLPAKVGGHGLTGGSLDIPQFRRLVLQQRLVNLGSMVLAAANDSAGVTTTATKTTEGATEDSSSPEADPEEYYEVELDKPYGIKFYKGSDGGTYIDVLAPGGNADKSKMITPGDKVIATSAVFGNEIWPAAEYGRTMYAVRQRIGPLLMKMQKRYGKKEDSAVSAAEISAQRNANVIGERLREIQIQNYQRKMEMKKQRGNDLQDGLQLYKKGAYEDALAKFESVLGLKPDNYEAAIASYNVACCYSKLNQIEAGLSALEESLEAGFDDYQKMRTDNDLANLRASERFKQVIDKYDEPFINESAIKALKGMFGGFFGKK